MVDAEGSPMLEVGNKSVGSENWFKIPFSDFWVCVWFRRWEATPVHGKERRPFEETAIFGECKLRLR